MIATPVPTHAALARAGARGRQARVRREADGARVDARPRSSSTWRRRRGVVLMPGHLLLYHPGVRKLKELVDSGELGDVLYVYGNRQNLGTIRPDENALWSLGVHDLSVILLLLGEEPARAVGARRVASSSTGVEDVVFCYLRFPSGQDRAHAPLLARPAQDAQADGRRLREDGVFDDMELDRKVTVYDKGGRAVARDLRRVAHPHRRHLQPARRERRAAAARVRATSSRSSAASRRPGRGGRDGLAVVERSSSSSARSSSSRHDGRSPRAPSSTTGDAAGRGRHRRGSRGLGKQPTLSAGARPQSASRCRPSRRPRSGDLAGAVVFAGSAPRRAGRSSATRPASASAARSATTSSSAAARSSRTTSRSAHRAGSRRTPTSPPTRMLEDDVFIAPCVVTTNDNFMGRTEERHALMQGPTIRRGARIGGGAVLLPGIEIGEEAFVGAGAVVLADVPPRARRRRQPGAADPRGAGRGAPLGPSAGLLTAQPVRARSGSAARRMWRSVPAGPAPPHGDDRVEAGLEGEDPAGPQGTWVTGVTCVVPGRQRTRVGRCPFGPSTETRRRCPARA